MTVKAILLFLIELIIYLYISEHIDPPSA